MSQSRGGRFRRGASPSRYRQMERLLLLWRLMRRMPSCTAEELREQLELQEGIQVSTRTVRRDADFLLAAGLIDAFKIQGGAFTYDAIPDALLEPERMAARHENRVARVHLTRLADPLPGHEPPDRSGWDESVTFNLTPLAESLEANGGNSELLPGVEEKLNDDHCQNPVADPAA